MENGSIINIKINYLEGIKQFMVGFVLSAFISDLPYFDF
jgi:hypothetical protein